MSKTSCIVPWSTIIIGTDGRANFCCDVPEPLTIDGRTGSVYRDSLDDLWNAHDLVAVRAAMARGERPETCRVCWDREASGGVSRRLLMNAAYRQLGGRLSAEGLTREGARSGYRLERRPDWYILELGNVCNLKCRSCGPLYSSRIAVDPVHRAWAATEQATPSGAAPTRHLRVVPENTRAWFEDIDGMADMIARGAGDNAALSLLGGEPFLSESTWRLLGALVARGAAARVFVGLQTNGQQRSSQLEELAPHFRGFNVSVSIDGHGRLFEYLRHGARWRTLVDNLGWLRQLKGLEIAALPTLQNGNALDLVTLLRFLDEEEVPILYNVVNWPPRLRPTNLPASVRRIAVERLRHYLDAECRPMNRGVVRAYCEILESAEDGFDGGLFHEFMAFTNDLDAARGESLCEVAPELVGLVRAAGIEWSNERRHPPSRGGGSTLQPAEVLRRVNRTVSAGDVVFAVYEGRQPGGYFSSGASVLAEIDAGLRAAGQPGLEGIRAVADFACHFGRMTRALRAALPHAAVYACDIDPNAVQFCAEELGALPVVTSWRPDEERLPGNLDCVICISLLTHTPLEHWRRALRAWVRMLQPGGVAAFTFLAETQVEAWLSGAMEHYGSYSPEQRSVTVRGVREQGFGFAALTSAYGGEPFYGIAFATPEVVRREIAASGFELLALAAEASSATGQGLALVRKPDEERGARTATPAVQRDVSLLAFYDGSGYAPEEGSEGSHAESLWARLVKARPTRPLPTELGFADPRVPEVRDEQAALAREHGVDGFCYLYLWRASGPRWDAPWRDLVANGRPDFPFCLMVAVDDEVPMPAEAARRLFEDIAPGLQDHRYVRVEGRPLIFVRDVGRLMEPRAIATEWRAAAAARGLGELHLSAAEPVAAECPQDLGFDSFLETPTAATEYAGVVAQALTRPWPGHRLFRTVECRREGNDSQSAELYEHWLRSTFDATRRRGERVVFVNAWNDWPRGRYLEPDDRDGRAALLATRRAVRGPGSGQVLLRQLRDALGEINGRAGAVLGELEQVLALHEHTRDRLLASVEVALGRNQVPRSETQHWVPVASRQLPPSGGGFALDLVGTVEGAELHGAPAPIPLRGPEVRLAGWAHAVNCAPGDVDLFLALESATGIGDLIFRVTERALRPDVAEAFPGHPSNCGFDAMVNISSLPPGTYGIAIVQRTLRAAYRDPTGVSVKRD